MHAQRYVLRAPAAKRLLLLPPWILQQAHSPSLDLQQQVGLNTAIYVLKTWDHLTWIEYEVYTELLAHDHKRNSYEYNTGAEAVAACRRHAKDSGQSAYGRRSTISSISPLTLEVVLQDKPSCIPDDTTTARHTQTPLQHEDAYQFHPRRQSIERP